MRKRYACIVNAALLLPVLLTAFCSSDNPGPATAKIYEKDNVTYVENPASPDTVPAGYALEEILSIGDTGDDENYLIVRPSPPKIDNNGNIYTMDYKKDSVFKYDGRGVFIQKFGRRGEGPGEAVFMRDFAVDEYNGMLLIMDSRLTKISRFLPDGSLHSEFKIDRYADRLFVPDKDAYYVVHTVYDDNDRQFNTVIKYSPDGRKLATSPKLPDDKYLILKKENRTISLKPPFCARSIFTISPDGLLYWGMSDEYRFEGYNTELHMVKVIEKVVVEQVTVTAEEKEQYIKQVKENIAKRGNDPSIIDSSVISRFPDHYPVYYFPCFDAENRLWVPIIARNDQVQHIDIFDSNGVFKETRAFKKPAGILTIGDIFDRAVIKGDLIYAAVRDNEENRFIKVYRMVKQPDAVEK